MLQDLFPRRQPGLTTWAEPGKAVFLQDNLTGQTVQTGIFDPSRPGPGNQMALLGDGFETVGISAFRRCMESDSTWVTVDEIGYLEAESEAYHKALRRLMEEKQVAAVIRKEKLPFLLELRHREDAFVVDLDDPFGSTGCVIMASGLGRRFGGNKLMVPFHGAPLISRILAATEGIFSRRVVVTRHEDVAALCRDQGVPVVLHNLPRRSDTVRLGLEAMGGVERCMFATADQPLLRKETVAALAIASANAPEMIWRAAWEEISGSPVVFPQWAFPELGNLPEGKGGSFLIKKYPERVRRHSVGDRYELKDVDSPEDLEELLER